MTWQAGDLAVCVDDSPCRCKCCGGSPVIYRAGQVFLVEGVCGVNQDTLAPMLLLNGLPLSRPRHAPGYHSLRFRKVVHDKHEQCEPEFVTLLKRIKRTVPASAMSAGTAETQSGSGLQPASAVGEAETPKASKDIGGPSQ